MTKEELIQKLNELAENHDTEKAHQNADRLLLDYIEDADVVEAYNNIYKWYS